MEQSNRRGQYVKTYMAPQLEQAQTEEMWAEINWAVRHSN